MIERDRMTKTEKEREEEEKKRRQLERERKKATHRRQGWEQGLLSPEKQTLPPGPRR